MDSTTNNLRICHVNSQSLIAHLDEFRLFFENKYFHIICLSETWLSPSVSDEFIELPGYNIQRCDRIGKKGGGVAFYSSTSLNIKVLSMSEGEYSAKPEFIIAEVTTCSEKLLLATMYRPPKVGFLSDFENIHNTISTRDFRGFRQENYLRDLAEQSWDFINMTSDIDEKIEIFNCFITRALDTNAPQRNLRSEGNRHRGSQKTSKHS